MTLKELSALYAGQAEGLRGRISQLRQLEQQTTDAKQLERLHRRRLQLSEMQRDVTAMMHITACYYEPGYHRDPRYSL